MIKILSRVPGETTLFETDDPAAAVQWVADLEADLSAVVISVDYEEV